MSNLDGFITIKELANTSKENLGLELEGRSKFPNCFDVIQPPKGIDGRWRTGLDELGSNINMIRDPQLREETRAKIKAEREELESLTGYDLRGNSKFWEEFYVELNPKKPLNMANPIDRIKYSVLMASQEVPGSLRESTKVEFHASKYYVSRQHEDVSEKVLKLKQESEAKAELMELIKTPDRAVLVGKYLGLPVSSTTPSDNMFDIFYTNIQNDEKTGFVAKFLRALKSTHEELSIKTIFDDGVKFNVIRLTEGYYQRGNITYGKTVSDVIKFLSSPQNSAELLSIQDEVENKRKFG